ncbi:hypothetical protein TTHERM_000845734 (macronuclear) [Tetrahymena thermophila SB210]|uniref:Uncharacterized protein n=1 Tax=Tetrahymena thermophila (strain SB210) TaxID=312017 RepID=W7XEE1_TETTS|nr:hypothetical protein TTHERM_000845734 [Tetrahymena thermophila SB210]EWS76052.1 hypothetical protein TTHERM_000845734 [Tetrahymena thermophila SB210]|eukprot:XP_012651403.1 hypothetical protein TTHERM_000845734 [Tetrahymena thermophila SB210]
MFHVQHALKEHIQIQIYLAKYPAKMAILWMIIVKNAFNVQTLNAFHVIKQINVLNVCKDIKYLQMVKLVWMYIARISMVNLTCLIKDALLMAISTSKIKFKQMIMKKNNRNFQLQILIILPKNKIHMVILQKFKLYQFFLNHWQQELSINRQSFMISKT